MAPGTEFARDFCARIGPLQLGVVLVFYILAQSYSTLFLRMVHSITCSSSFSSSLSSEM